MIVKNEEDVLARCLDSVKTVADEIIIVDTGSTDRTREIARQYTRHVYDFKWIDDFSAARNYAFSLATKEYVMWLDADDVVLPEDADKMTALKQFVGIDVFYLRYHVSFHSDGSPTFSYYRERIMRNCASARWHDPIHEAVIPFGKTMFSDAAVCHKKIRQAPSGRNLAIYDKYIENGGVLSPRMKYYYARELMYNGFEQKASSVFSDFLLDKGGLVENKISACRDLYRCAEKIGKPSLDILTKSFEYGAPCAEILCEMGRYFFEKNAWAQAEYWYELAAAKPPVEDGFGFVEKDCYGYIPYLQLCVICDRTGRTDKAIAYNEMAGRLKPNSEAYLYNSKYFQKITKKK